MLHFIHFLQPCLAAVCFASCGLLVPTIRPSTIEWCHQVNISPISNRSRLFAPVRLGQILGVIKYRVICTDFIEYWTAVVASSGFYLERAGLSLQLTRPWCVVCLDIVAGLKYRDIKCWISPKPSSSVRLSVASTWVSAQLTVSASPLAGMTMAPHLEGHEIAFNASDRKSWKKYTRSMDDYLKCESLEVSDCGR